MEAKISEISSPVDIGDEFGEMPENTGVIDDSAAASTEDEDLLVSEKHSEKIIIQLNNSGKMVQKEDEKMLLDDQNSSLAEKQDIETNLNNSESYLECRICRSTDEEPLISPCKCSGSSKWIHQSCLVQWFQISRATKCELCSEKIIIKKFVKPVREVGILINIKSSCVFWGWLNNEFTLHCIEMALAACHKNVTQIKARKSESRFLN